MWTTGQGWRRGRILGRGSLLQIALLLLLHNIRADNSRQQKIHELMSKEELASVFQVTEHHLVPEYEVVHVHSRKQKRDTDQIHQVSLRVFGRDLELELRRNLNLVPENRNLDLFFAENDKDDISYVIDDQIESADLGSVYQDVRTQAALLLYKQEAGEQHYMDGTIGDDLVVKPAPPSVKNYMYNSPLTSEPPSHWSNHDEKTSHWSDPDIHSDRNISKPNYLEEEEEDLPEDYAFLDEDDDVKAYNRLDRRFRRDVSCSTCIKTGLHIVYKRKDDEKHMGDYEVMETDEDEKPETFSTPENKTHSRKKRQAPFMIFPEILVIVDYDGYRLHGEDNIAIKRYVISFWNGVDLRYKLLQGPSVKISIAGIIISRGRDATPYLERNRVGRDAIDAASALTDMGKYLFLERRLPVYDIAVAITKLDMCRRKTRHGDCNRGTAGFAYVGGACVVNKRLEKVNSVAIVEDTGGFSGIIVAAHELGHLLGAVHDGSPPPSYLGGPGAVKCRWEDGYIMSDLRHTSKGFKWSYCTVNQFHHFLNGETATCMYNSPHEDESLPRVLPGKLLSLDAQCRKDRGTSACFKDDRVCAQLFCFDAGSGYCVSYRPAAEGSRCGDNQMCLNGKCISENENAIDYGDAFLRRTGTAISTTFEEVPDKHRTDWDLPSSQPSPTPPSYPTPTPPPPPQSTTLPWWRRLQLKLMDRQAELSSTSSTTTTASIIVSTTTTTTAPPPTTTTKSSVEEKELEERVDDDELNELDLLEEGCEDRITNIAGSLSCKAFLRSFAYQYCKHKYIEKNCCSSHKRFCSGSTHG